MQQAVNEGIKVFDNYKDLLSLRPDLVVICSNLKNYPRIVEETLSYNLNTVIEKPMAMTFEDGMQMYNAYRKANACFAVNWPVAWFKSFAVAKQTADNGEIGDVLRVHYRSPATLGPYAQNGTHLTDGNTEYWYCDGCNKYFSDEAGTQKIVLSDTVIAKLTEHTADDIGWHWDEDSHWHTCACGAIIEEADHTFEWIIDKEATATEAGSRHEQCTICGYAKEAAEIPATGTPSEPSQSTETPSTPETGDNSNIVLLVFFMLVAGAVLICTTVYSRKRRYNR